MKTLSWKHGFKRTFESYEELEEYFENHFEEWKIQKIGTKVIGLTIYVFNGYYTNSPTPKE